MMEEDAPTNHDITAEFATYEDFLDSQITALDLYYLEDEELARQLVEVGNKGTGETLKREEFLARKLAAEANKQLKKNSTQTLSSADKNFSDPLLAELAKREEPNRSGKMTSIVFVRDKNSKGQEISGYIDFAHRLKTEDFEPYFSGRKKLLPKPTDLSFYNWENQIICSNNTPNYQVLAESVKGILFKNKRDRKIVNVDPNTPPGDNSTRSEVVTDRYVQVVIYDHITRRKT